METDTFLPYATEIQAKYLRAVEKHGSIRKAATALGVHHSSISRAMTAVRRKAARIDPSQHATKAPPGYKLRGVSTLLDGEGNISAQWVKTKAENTNVLEAIRDAMSEITETHAGRLHPLPKPVITEDVFTWYKIPDAHIGLLAWAEETGESFDLKHAEALYKSVFDRLTQRSPRAKKAALVNLGDFANIDGQSNATTKGTPQDSDGRWPKIARALVRLSLYFIDRLLVQNDEVWVYTIAGNHDADTGVMLAVALEAIYRNEPRVHVSVDPSAVQVVQYGRNLVAVSHGDKGRPEALPGLVAANYPEAWGATTRRHAYTGHVHKDRWIDLPGMTVEFLRSLTPDSAWMKTWHHTPHDLKCDTWDRERGIIERTIEAAPCSPVVRKAQVVK